MKMSILRVYGQWIVVTVMVAVVLFASAGRLDLPMLIEQFGDAYRVYMRRTGRLLPRLVHRSG